MKIFFLSIIISGLSATNAWADFTAQVNTKSVAVNDTFQLTLSSDDISQQSTPDLTPLESDFKILRLSQSMQTHIINGYTSQKYNWIIKLSPKTTGQLTIPPISLTTSKGIESTIPINIQSVEQSQLATQNNQSIHITAILGDISKEKTDKNSHYIFQEIPLTVRIETTQPVAKAELIVTDIPDVEIEQQGEDKLSQTMSNGQAVTTIERLYVLRPQKIGTYTIPPIVIKGNFRSNQLPPRSQFGFGDFFGSQLNNQIGKAFVAKTSAITLDIKANPNSTNDWFLPAKTVELFSEWLHNGEKTDKPTLTVGEPATRRISLVAVGAVPEQLPKLEVPEVDGVQFYVDSDTTEKVLTNKGIVARRVVDVSVVPEYEGEFILPEINVKWQNTKTDMAEIAILAPEIIEVQDTNSTINPIINPNESVAKSENKNSTIDSILEVENATKHKSWLLMSWLTLAGVLFIIVGNMYRNTIPHRLKKLGNIDLKNENAKHSNDMATLAKAEKDIQRAIDNKSMEQLYQSLLSYKSTIQANTNLMTNIMDSQANKDTLQHIEIVQALLESELYNATTGKSANEKREVDFESITQSINQLFNTRKVDLTRVKGGLPKLYPK